MLKNIYIGKWIDI